MNFDPDVTCSDPGRPERGVFTRLFRARALTHLVDDSRLPGEGVALYSLSDPRDLREARYVGITRSPRRRLLQHWNSAKLWLPDQRPWWIASPELRPLYDWIRDLYNDEQRLPVMVVCAWRENAKTARIAERDLIYECLARGLPLLNVEREILGRQIPLL